MTSFKEAYQRTAKSEKGYSFHSSDRGGETLNGVSRVHWPDWKVWRYIDYLKTEPGFPENIPYYELEPYFEEFYMKNFWEPIKLIPDQSIANQIYDIAVNSGVNTAVKILQHNLNLLNRGGKDYPDVKADGVLGDKTLEALKTFLSKRPKENMLFLIWYEQLEGWIDLVKADESQEDFLNGWLKRFQHNVNGALA